MPVPRSPGGWAQRLPLPALRQRIGRHVLVSLVLVWGLGSAVILAVGNHFVAEAFDRALLDDAHARETMAELVDIFGRENLYVEIHDHGLEPQRKVTPGLLKLAAEFGLKTVAANDVHFLHRADHEAHDVMICIGTGSIEGAMARVMSM